MWDWAGKATRDAREFAAAHSLAFTGDDAPALPASLDVHPFEVDKRRLCVSGEWRGRPVQRFVVGGTTVELMALPRPLPRLQVIPSGLERGAMAFGGRVVLTGDPAFDRAVSVITDNEAFAAAFLTPSMREALIHPAAAGRALTIDGGSMYTWGHDVETLDYARVRLDFLSVLAGRIDPAVWANFDLSIQNVSAAWVPGPQREDIGQWVVAQIPVDDAGAPMGDTAEFEVSVLEAELDITFAPEPSVPTNVGPQFAVAQVPQF